MKLLSPPLFSAMWRTDWIPTPFPVRLDDWENMIFLLYFPFKGIFHLDQGKVLMMKVNLCMDSPVERLCFQAGFQSIFQKVGENQAHIDLVYGNVGWQSCICLERNVLPFCQSGIMADHAVGRLVFTKMQVVVWNFTVCIGKVFFYFFQISLFRKGRKLQKVMADIVSCLPCLLYGRAKVLISCLLKGEKMVFLLKPCILFRLLAIIRNIV